MQGGRRLPLCGTRHSKKKPGDYAPSGPHSIKARRPLGDEGRLLDDEGALAARFTIARITHASGSPAGVLPGLMRREDWRHYAARLRGRASTPDTESTSNQQPLPL